MIWARARVFLFLLLGFLGPGCFVSFSAQEIGTETGSESTTQDSSSATQETTDGTGSSDTQDTEDSGTTSTILPVCPSGVNFLSEPTFTQVATCKASGQGTQFLDACPSPQVLVGFRGLLQNVPNTNQDFHARFQALCGTLSLDADGEQCHVHVQEGSTLAERGLDGTEEWERRCLADEVLVGFSAKTGSNIDQLTFFCAPVFIELFSSGYSIIRGPSSALAPAGKGGGSLNFGPLECPEGALATIAHIETTRSLISFGLGCQAPSPAP